MPQLTGGYILEAVAKILERNGVSSPFRSLLRQLSSFDLSGTISVEEVQRNPYLDVVRNIIARGIPTRPSMELEEDILKNMGLGNSFQEELGSFIWDKAIPESTSALLWRAFHPLEPRIDKGSTLFKLDQSKAGSSLEKKLFYEMPQMFDQDLTSILQQNLVWQRELTSIVPASSFKHQQVDFSFEFPYEVDRKKGIILEADGGQHDEPSQQFHDLLRELAAGKQQWETIRITANDFSLAFPSHPRWKEIKNGITTSLGTLGDILTKNIREPLFVSAPGRQALQLALTPLAVARIQRAVLEYIGQPGLEMDAPFWEIIVLERDVPCADWAFIDLKRIFEHLNILTEGAVPRLPEIKLTIWQTRESEDMELAKVYPNQRQIIESIPTDAVCDLFMDISTLLQAQVIEPLIPFRSAKHVAVIRNCQYPRKSRQVYANSHLPYGVFTYLKDNRESSREENPLMVESLRFFLRWFFRKVNFRNGQLPILQRALKPESVIGLLPTGGGKSLTYQLAALLQPGVTLVIDPLKSLMKDQIRGLTNHWIDFSTVINSNLSREEKIENQLKIERGEALLAFISPERLQMQDFRGVLANMTTNQCYFAYCVIDEAHCVSEWGHDFRTSYLQLGKNAMNHCKTKTGQPIPLFGLTATASYDVLADIQRELSEELNPLREDAIVRHESTKRAELYYRFIKASPSSTFHNFWDYSRVVGEAKQQAVIELISNQIIPDFEQIASEPQIGEGVRKLNPQEISQFFQGNGQAGLIVFCPHKKGPFGVKDLLPKIQTGCHPAKSGMFMGADNIDFLQAQKDQELSDENQDKFLKNELDILVATKAFGMGIDKSNIRATIHLNYPGSLESFMQESGRAGRDQKPALCYVVFNDLTFEGQNKDKDINLFFFNQSFKGADKELENISELLHEIFLPNQKSVLEAELEGLLDFPVQIRTWTSENGKKYVSIQEDFDHKVGDIGCWGNYPEYPDKEYPNSNTILKQCKALLLQKAGNSSLWDFTHAPAEGTRKGILPRLSKLPLNAPYSLQLYYSNNKSERVQQITTWLRRVIDADRFNEDVVYSKITKADHFEDFISKLGETINDQHKIRRKASELDAIRGHTKGTSLGNFRKLYNGFRDKQDTEKAIYRLSILGIIDDYTIDYKTGIISISGRKKTDEQYREHLRQYILKYYSEARTTVILNKLPKTRAKTTDNLLSYARLLVEFIYQAVAEKRRRAIDDMETALDIGLEKDNDEFKEYVDLYFNSKYSRRDYEIDGKPYSLLIDTDSSRLSNQETIWKYIEATEIDPSAAENENIKHLRGACIKLLAANPENFALLFLEAFCLWRLEYTNPKFYPDLEDNLRKGLENLQMESNLSDTELEAFFEKYKERVFRNQETIKDYFNPEFGDIILDSHLDTIHNATKILSQLNKKLSHV